MSSPMPRMVVRDMVGATDETGALVSATDRTVELSLHELGRLTAELGAEGMTALVAYLGVLRKETLPGEREALVLNEFSGRWLMENTTLTRNAAYRAQKAVEDTGIFDRVVGSPGQGSRGKQRAVLNGGKVLIAGATQQDVEDLKVARRGARPAPFSRKAGERDNGLQSPYSQEVGEREYGPIPRIPGDRENGAANPSSSQVRGGLAENRQQGGGATSDQSSSGEVSDSLMTGTTAGVAGVVPSVLAPALLTDRDHVVGVVREALNDARYAERLEQVLGLLGLEGPSSSHVDLLVSAFADLLANPQSVWGTYAAVGVTVKQRRMSAEVAVERFILGVVAALGVGRLASWGGFLGSTMRPEWKPLPSASLVRFETALLAMAESAARRERLRAEAYAATERRAGARTASRQPEEPVEAVVSDSAGTGATDGPDATDDADEPELGPADLPDSVVEQHAKAAFANPDLAGLAKIGRRDNPAFVRRMVWMHLSATGEVPGAAAS